MAAEEAHMKKKLQIFLAEMLRFGTVKGFKYFVMYPRGREEMVLSVLNQPQSVGFVPAAKYDVAAEHKRRLCKSGSFSSNHLPYDHRSLMLSIRSQMVLSTHGVQDVGLPPASPSEHESMPVDEKSTLFLIAGYGRYNCPYVWVRSNHDRLVKLTGDSSREKDCPLKLKTTMKWKDTDICVWDVISELVKLCTYPAPRNPFEIDFAYFTMLPLSDRVLATAAMVNILQKILVNIPDQKQYAGPVFEELQMITKEHFKALEEMVQSQGLPILQQQQQQNKQQQQQKTRASGYSTNRVRTSSYNQSTYPYDTSQSSVNPSMSSQSSQYGYNNVAPPLF